MELQILKWAGKRLRLSGKRARLDVSHLEAGTTKPGGNTNPSQPIDTISSSVVNVSLDSSKFTFSLSPNVSNFDHYEYYVTGYAANKGTTTSNTITIQSIIDKYSLTAPDNSSTNYTLNVRAYSTQGNRTNIATKQFTVQGKVIEVNKFKIDDFNPVEDVIVSAEPSKGDRVIIVCRHSERTTVSGGSGTLTDTGIQWAKDNGTRIKASCQSANKFTDTSNDYYASTTVPRCRQTAYFIGMGRGYSAYNNNSFNGSSNPSNFKNPSCIGAYDLISGIGGMQYGGDIDWLALSVLTDDHFSEVKARVDQKVPAIISETNGHPFSLLVTHDLFIVPLIETMFPDIQFERYKVSGKENQTGKGTNDGEWCGYMSGVCFIVHSDGTYDAWPIEGVEGNDGKYHGVQN